MGCFNVFNAKRFGQICLILSYVLMSSFFVACFGQDHISKWVVFPCQWVHQAQPQGVDGGDGKGTEMGDGPKVSKGL